MREKDRDLRRRRQRRNKRLKIRAQEELAKKVERTQASKRTVKKVQPAAEAPSGEGGEEKKKAPAKSAAKKAPAKKEADGAPAVPESSEG
jgi:hypothetical protein